MAIKQKKNGKHLVDIRDEYGTRIQRTFKSKSDAKTFEGDIYRKKYEILLVKNNSIVNLVSERIREWQKAYLSELSRIVT